MGFIKKYDLACKIGSYNKDGNEKGIYKNVGSVMEGDDGKKFIFIDLKVLLIFRMLMNLKLYT